MDGEFILNARLPPEIGAVVGKALELAVEAVRPPGGKFPRKHRCRFRRTLACRCIPAHRRELSRASRRGDGRRLLGGSGSSRRAHRSGGPVGSRRRHGGGPHRCELEDGPALALDTARRLACDATVVGIVEGDDGEPLDIGRKSRSIPAAIAER